jgi:hypothetical protein
MPEMKEASADKDNDAKKPLADMEERRPITSKTKKHPR